MAPITEAEFVQLRNARSEAEFNMVSHAIRQSRGGNPSSSMGKLIKVEAERNFS